MRQNAYIAGVAMTRFGKHLDRSLKSLAAEAVLGALRDANIDESSLEAAWVGNVGAGVISGQVCVPGQVVLRDMGIGGLNSKGFRISTRSLEDPRYRTLIIGAGQGKADDLSGLHARSLIEQTARPDGVRGAWSWPKHDPLPRRTDRGHSHRSRRHSTCAPANPR